MTHNHHHSAVNDDVHKRLTIGVVGNRQIYEGTTIVRYEQILLRGIRAAARQRGCNLLLACGVGPDSEPYQWLPAWPVKLPHTNFVPVGPWNTAGLIAIPPFSDVQHQAVQEVTPPGYPIVFTFPQEGYPSVGPANTDGIAQAFAHLVAHGHRRIAFIAADAHTGGDGAERLRAYRSAVATHGLPLDDRLIGYGEHDVHQSYRVLRQMLQAGVDFTAVLASNDESAIGVLRALNDAGRRIPEDVAVIGFDDVLYAKAQTPPLTTIRHPTFELGYRAVELLLDYITGRRVEIVSLRVPTRLIVRESCGCQPYIANLREPRTENREPPHSSALSSEIMSDCCSSPVELVAASSDWSNPAGAEAQALAQAMVDAVSAETHYSSIAQLHARCQQLVAAFLASLVSNNRFTVALDQVLHEAETTNDEPYAWQAAISTLHNHFDRLLAQQPQGAARHLAAQIIDQARVRISERQRRQHTRFLVHEAERIERIGTMTMRLLTALELQQILAILADHLPSIGIRHAHIALFEAEGDDQEAWCSLFTCSATEPLAARRFPSRCFPPPELFDTAEPYQLALLPLIVEGGPSGFVAFDAGYLEPCGLIVRHVAAAFRNSQLHTAAEQGRQLAEEANRLKSRFLSTVSHELRTPLNLIVGLSDMLLRERELFADSAAHDLERIYLNAQHLGRLIGDVLDLASSEADQLRLYQEPLDLAEILQPVVVTGAQMAREKGLEWHVRLPAAGPWVCGDRTRLRQVTLNLLSNAVKFTDRGAITLELFADTTRATVTIRDTGLGVPFDDQQRIFDEFRSSERTAGRGYGGLGLGLAICKQLIERQGGTIGVHSPGMEDGGATFFFSLPLLEASTSQATSEPTLHTDRPTVVFLSEHGRIDAGLSAMLDGRGFAVHVQQADTDADWLPRLIAMPSAALILDAALATRRGWEILGVLKRHATTARLPVLMYALDPNDDRGSLLELDYLLKPLDPEQLTHALDLQRAWGDQPSGTRTILVVDDDPDTLALHTRLIRQQLPDSRIMQARNGREALEAVNQTRPNLVLLDLMMPQLDGFGVLEAMRAHEVTRDVPVVVLTAQMLTEDDVARLNAGVAAILSKGLFTSNEIIGHIESALARQRKLGGTMQRVVRRAVAFIHTHYAAPITREQLASHVGVNGDHLTASFRQEMGITPIAYLNRYRINQARVLLKESSRSVTEVASSVGFSDLANFSRTFNREVGMSPNAYRRA